MNIIKRNTSNTKSKYLDLLKKQKMKGGAESNKQEMSYQDGKYVGEMKDGIPHGQGSLTYKNGEVYEGYWFNGKRHGRGIMRYKNGEVYEGQWDFDRIDGKGKYTYKNGAFMMVNG